MWYYSTDGKQQGPIDDAALDGLVATGAITLATYVWKDGMTDWAPLAQVRLGGSPLDAASTDATRCSVCGRQVGADNLLELIGKRVCADCKPVAVQSLKEGVPLHSKDVSAWRDGKKVVAFDKTALPPRCYKCNQDVVGAPIKRKLYWHHPAWYLLLLLRAVPYLIVAIFIRKRATLDVYLCESHRLLRRNFLIAGWSAFALGLALTFTGIPTQNPWLSASGGLLVIVSLIVRIVGGRLATPSKITKDGKVWLGGSGKEFLASLPDWPTPGQ